MGIQHVLVEKKKVLFQAIIILSVESFKGRYGTPPHFLHKFGAAFWRYLGMENSSILTVYVSPELAKEIERRAAATSLSISAYTRLLLVNSLIERST